MRLGALYGCAALIALLGAFPAHAQCTGPDGVRGEQVYNDTHCVMQYCDGTEWKAMGAMPAECTSSDPCAGSPSPGDQCADGSFFVGSLNVDGVSGDEQIFITAGAFETTAQWDDGTFENDPVGLVDGLTNTTNLLTPGAGGQASTVHPAAEYCANTLDTADGGAPAHGKSDWYLPARDELEMIYDNLIGSGLDTDGDADFKSDTFGFWVDNAAPGDNEWYWSSSKAFNSSARNLLFSTGLFDFASKDDTLSVRCIRRE